MNDRSALAAAQGAAGQDELEQKNAKVAEEAAEKEQQGTEETKEEQVVVAEQGDATGSLASPARDTLTPTLSQGEREKTAERIRQSEALPAGLRTRLAELVLASDSAAAEQAIRAVETSLPLALRVGGGEIARPAHPGGDVFFHGDADAVSEEAAEALARGQLARSGMLRGQRVRE